MKTVTQHAISEIAYYECDVSGEPLPEGPAVTLSIHCGYGSPFDGTDLELHLSGKAAEAVLPLLRALLLAGSRLGNTRRRKVRVHLRQDDIAPVA